MKTTLEIKNKTRTKELEELAQTLEERKDKRASRKLEELERFQKIAVGRELKMVELKEEIKKLKEELEEI